MEKKEEKCDDCGQDLKNKIQIYPKEGGILCEQCNCRKAE